MRWEALFSDLRAQSAAQQQETFEAEVAEAVGLAWSRTPLSDRVRAHIGHRLTLHLDGGAVMSLRVGEVGGNWLSGSTVAQAWLIPTAAVMTVTGLSRRAQSEASPSQQRLGIGAPLRVLAAAREPVVVHGGNGTLTEGVLIGVGADFIDIRSATESKEIRTVPMHALIGVCSTVEPQ